MKTKRKFKLLLSSLIALVCVSASCFTVTFAWFTALRTEDTFINAITITNPSDLNVRYFSLKKNYKMKDVDGNGTLDKAYVGYTSNDILPTDFGTSTDEMPTIVENYCDELTLNDGKLIDESGYWVNSLENFFGAVPSGASNNVFNGNFYPGKKFTFILEIDCNLTTPPKPDCIFITPTKIENGYIHYNSSNSGTKLDGCYDNSPVYCPSIDQPDKHPFSDALNLSVGWCMGDDLANNFKYPPADVFREFCKKKGSDMTSFIPTVGKTSYGPSDLPNLVPTRNSYYSDTSQGGPYRCSPGGTYIPLFSVDKNKKTYIWLNLEFSDDPSTYVDGNSNVYMNKYSSITFTLNSMTSTMMPFFHDNPYGLFSS